MSPKPRPDYLKKHVLTIIDSLTCFIFFLKIYQYHSLQHNVHIYNLYTNVYKASRYSYNYVYVEPSPN